MNKRLSARNLMAEAGRVEDPETAAVYQRVLSVALSRIEGKEFSERRPTAGISMTLGDGLIAAEFKPDLVNSPEGWQVKRIYLRIKTKTKKGGNLTSGKFLITPEGRLIGKSWVISTAPEVLKIAQHLVKLLAKGDAYLLAAADSDKCASCGRKLTDPKSREAGIGPECIQHFQKRYDVATALAFDAEELARQVKAIRSRLMKEHPDRGGDGDGALFAELTAELDRLRGLQRMAA